MTLRAGLAFLDGFPSNHGGKTARETNLFLVDWVE